MSPFYENRLAKFPADPETDVVAENCTSRGRSNDPADVQGVLGAGIYGSGDQDGFPGHRDARTFQHHDHEDRAIAVMPDKVLDCVAIEKIQACRLPSAARDPDAAIRAIGQAPRRSRRPSRAFGASLDPSLNDRAELFLAARRGLAPGAGMPTPSYQIVLGHMLV